MPNSSKDKDSTVQIIEQIEYKLRKYINLKNVEKVTLTVSYMESLYFSFLFVSRSKST